MKRFIIVFYILIMLSLPLSIVMLSGNIVLRVPETYTYHFNDSQVVDYVGSYVTGSEFADAIADYYNSPGRGEFQVYEENGDFRDPIFDSNESQVMAKAKRIMTLCLFAGILLFLSAIVIYYYLYTCVSRITLRRVGFASIIISAVFIAAVPIAISRKVFRAVLYTRMIGITLGRNSNLKLLLGSPFEKTYMIFATVLAVAILAVLTYIHHSITREKRLFS